MDCYVGRGRATACVFTPSNLRVLIPKWAGTSSFEKNLKKTTKIATKKKLPEHPVESRR
jgi:hypothetical protein